MHTVWRLARTLILPENGNSSRFYTFPNNYWQSFLIHYFLCTKVKLFFFSNFRFKRHKMELLVAPVEHIIFDIEIALGNQLGAQPLPFPGMDKSGAAVCDFYVRSNCSKAASCPFRHIRGDKTIVCKHWLRGLCKKGDQCEFLHEYDMSKMPECYFYSRFNACHNKECPFLHIDPEAKIKDCPWYDRGFCRHGPNCRYRHMRRILCVNYLAGFCPAGQSCEQAHPR